MNIQITAKKIEIAQDLRDIIKEKVSKLEKYNNRVQTIDVVIKAEERSIFCELIAGVDGRESVIVEVAGETIQAAVDLAVSKTERALRKGKERERESGRRHVATNKNEIRDMP